MAYLKFRQPIYNPGSVFLRWHYWELLPNGEGEMLTEYTAGVTDPADSQQLTPFKEASGADLYEGDIVEAGYPDGPFIVKWNDGNYGPGLYSKHGGLSITGGYELFTSPIRIKLIGNIIENPELI